MTYRVFVRGVSERVSSRELGDIFSKYGKVVNVKTGMAGFAFVDFADDRGVQAAIKALDGSILEGQKIVVEKSRDIPGASMYSSFPTLMQTGPTLQSEDNVGGFLEVGERSSFEGKYPPIKPGETPTCFNCRKPGHLARDCTEKPRNPMYLDTRGTRITDIDPRSRPPRYYPSHENRRDREYVSRSPPRDHQFHRSGSPRREYERSESYSREYREYHPSQREYPPRDYPPRDYPPRDYPPRDYPPRDYPPRDYGRDYPPRDFPPRDYRREEARDPRDIRDVRDVRDRERELRDPRELREREYSRSYDYPDSISRQDRESYQRHAAEEEFKRRQGYAEYGSREGRTLRGSPERAYGRGRSRSPEQHPRDERYAFKTDPKQLSSREREYYAGRERVRTPPTSSHDDWVRPEFGFGQINSPQHPHTPDHIVKNPLENGENSYG